MLNVVVDLERGVYIVSRNNGKEIITKSINENGTKSYNSKDMQARREEVTKSIPYVPRDRLKQMDTVLYDAIEEFDLKYGTNYRKTYVHTTIESIPFKSQSEKQQALNKRTNEIKAKELEEAGISIEYNLSLFGASKNLSLLDRIKAFRIAFSQRLNGININMRKKQAQLPEPIELTVFDESEKSETVQESNTGAQPEATPTIELADKVTPESVPTIEIISKTAQEDEQSQNKKSKKDKRAKNKKKKQERKNLPTDKKQKIGRRKTIQASKKKSRDEGKLKNRYEEVIEENKAKKAAAEQRIIEAAKRAEEQAKKEEQERIAKEKQEAEARIAKEKQEAEERAKAEQQESKVENQDKKVVVTPRIRKLLIGRNASETGETTLKRFKRTIKDQADSIRNKVHVPKMSKRTLGGAAGVVVLVVAAALTIKYGTHQNTQLNTTEIDRTPPAQSTEVVTPTENEVPSYEVGDITESETLSYEIGDMSKGETPSYEIGDAAEGETTSYETGDVVEGEAPSYKIEDSVEGEVPSYKVEKSTEDGQAPNSSKDSRIEYLSSVRVGATMNIQEGKYYECPDGTGNSGDFKKYQDSTKEITIIGVTTNEKYFSIEDPNVSLYEIMQQYPEAKFAYHFVAKNKDGTTTVLGWLTANSVQNQKAEDSIERVEEDVER